MAKAKKEKKKGAGAGWYRSDLRNVWNKSPMKWEAYDRAKVKPAWLKCEKCGKESYYKLIEIDHINPVVSVTPDKLDELFPGDEWETAKRAFRLNCPSSGLQVLCEVCHSGKSKAENKKRGAK